MRASAGTSSFRKQPTLERCLAEAERRATELRQELEADPSAASRREKAARERAAQERLQRVQAAMEACRQVQAKKDERKGDSLKHAARAWIN